MAVKQRHEFTNVNGKYPNYQKVGKITRMRVQFVPGSSFRRAAHAKSLGTRLSRAVLAQLVFIKRAGMEPAQLGTFSPASVNDIEPNPCCIHAAAVLCQVLN